MMQIPVIWRAQVNHIAWFILILSSHKFCVWKGNSFINAYSVRSDAKLPVSMPFNMLIFHCASPVNPDSNILTLKDGLRQHKLLVNLAPKSVELHISKWSATLLIYTRVAHVAVYSASWFTVKAVNSIFAWAAILTYIWKYGNACKWMNWDTLL